MGKGIYCMTETMNTNAEVNQADVKRFRLGLITGICAYAK
jgi:hypothetical protein